MTTMDDPTVKGKLAKALLGAVNGSDAHVNDNVQQPEEQPDAIIAPQSPSLKAEMPFGPPMPAPQDRVSQLVSRRDAIGAPPSSLKGKVLQSLATALPTLAGAAFGGTYGASGAAEGTQEAIAAQKQQQAVQRQSLEKEDERNRQAHAQDIQAEITGRGAVAAERAEGLQNVANTRAEMQRAIDAANNNTKSALADKAQTGRAAQMDATMLQHGFTKDENGAYVATPEKVAKDAAEADYKKAITDHQQAMADFEKTRNDPNSPAFKAAQARTAVTGQRLALSQKQFELRAFGTVNGEAPNGSLIADNGGSIGTAFQQNVRPTGVERNKADMATSARGEIDNMRKIVQSRPDIFGPAAGRKTDFTVWLGSQDPEAQRFRAARDIVTDHLAGTFGGRSAETLQKLEGSLGAFKDNPAAIMAGLNELDNAAKTFVDKGTVKAKGNGAPSPSLNKDIAPKKGDVRKGYVFQGGDPGDSKNWKKQ